MPSSSGLLAAAGSAPRRDPLRPRRAAGHAQPRQTRRPHRHPPRTAGRPPPAAPPPVAAAPPAARTISSSTRRCPRARTSATSCRSPRGSAVQGAAGAAAGKKITVTLPAPPTYGAGDRRADPADPEPERRPAARPAVRTMQHEYRAVIDATIAGCPRSSGARSRSRSTSARCGPCAPRRRRSASARGRSRRRCTTSRAPAVSGARLLAKQSVAFDRHAFEVAVEATPAPWVGVDATSGADASGTDVVLGVTVRRVAATVAGGALPAAGAAEPPSSSSASSSPTGGASSSARSSRSATSTTSTSATASGSPTSRSPASPASRTRSACASTSRWRRGRWPPSSRRQKGLATEILN